MGKNGLKIRFQILIIILVALIAGFAAGLTGELWINDFLQNGTVEKEKIQTLTERLNELTERQEKKLKDVLAEKDLSVSQTIENVRPAIVSLYTNKTNTNTWADILMPQNYLGVGSIITTDGWIVTDQSVVSDSIDKIAVSFEKEVFPVETAVCDTSTTICFIKIDSKDLPVVDLTSREFLTNGQTALAISLNEVFPSNIESLYYTPIANRIDLIHSSENFYKFVKLNEDLDKKWQGAPIVNLNGQVFGILGSNNLIISIDNIQNIMKQAIADQKITRTYLGVNYIDLAQATGWTKYEEIKAGALVFSADSKPAITSQSPAQKAGLKPGDIIISVEDEPINETNSLTTLIQAYKPNQEIKLKVLRGEQEIELNVTLTEI